MSDDEHLLVGLRDRYYYKELKKQFGDPELIFFEHQWIDYFKQFSEDVTHTEEMEILEVIRTEVLINRGMEDRQDVLKNIDRLNKLIEDEMDKLATVGTPAAKVIWCFWIQLKKLLRENRFAINIDNPVSIQGIKLKTWAEFHPNDL